MLQVQPLGARVPIFRQLQADRSPVILVNIFQVAETDIPSLEQCVHNSVAVSLHPSLGCESLRRTVGLTIVVSCSDRSSRCPTQKLSPNNESFWRRSDKIEWVAGDQSQLLMPGRIQYLNIVRSHDLCGGDSVFIFPRLNHYLDCVISAYEPQRTKERVSMAGHPDITTVSRQRRTPYVSGAPLKLAFLRTF